MLKDKNGIIRKTREYIKAHEMICPGQTVVAAVSGGGDSMALLLLLSSLREELGFSLCAAYFDHQLRPESAHEGDLAEELANSLNIPFYRGAAPVRELSAGENLENFARKIRYGFFKDVARLTKAQRIATAHHGDDQAETLLLHLLRGSGMEGLAAIAPVEGRLIRPFIAVSKKDILVFCHENNLKYATDKSNFCLDYTRNRLRIEIMPLLKTFNPNLVETLFSTTEICREENQLLQLATVGAIEDARLPSEGLRGGVLSSLPLALQRRVLRLAYEEYAMPRGLFGGALGFEHTQRVLGLNEGQMLPLPNGVWAYRQNGDILFSKNKPELPRFTQNIFIKCGDFYDLADWGWEYQGRILNYQQAKELLSRRDFPDDMLLIPEKYLPQLSFRTRLEGDFLQPSGMIGKKKIKDLFIDSKIPLFKRNSWPLLLLGDEIVWVPKLRRAQIPEGKNNYVRIICRPLPNA